MFLYCFLGKLNVSLPFSLAFYNNLINVLPVIGLPPNAFEGPENLNSKQGNYSVRFNCAVFQDSLLIFFSHRIVPESARWLVIRGRLAEAEGILSNIARKNGIAVPKILLQVSRPLSVVGNRYGCLDLLSNLKIAKITIVLFYLW